MERTIRCPLCSHPYVVYGYYAGDQSACPPCRSAARQLMRAQDDRAFAEQAKKLTQDLTEALRRRTP